MEAIKVQVGETVMEYPADIAGYADHRLSTRTVSLFEAQRQTKAFFRANQDEALKALNFWVTLDESGLAYHVEVSRTGTHRIMAAAPLPGPDNVRELYVA